MATVAMIPVEQYLATSYRPDCDYIDGEVVERNLGELSHADLQTSIASWLKARRKQFRIRAYVELRLRINESRFRIPDVMAISEDAPRERVVVTPPLLCVEVLSPGDTLKQTRERAQDYLSIGVPVCWIVDPVDLRGWIVTSAGITEATDGILRAGEIVMPLAEVAED